ncbi:MAG: AAC(3) family N-acetyltransferase [Planctomycetota bacterium]|nr:AAC(3) family N-acetyltransferase [Planctomycetota bacterium]
MPGDTPFSKDGLLSDLRRLGIAPGDVLLIHSNLRSIGSVKELIKAPDTGMAWLLEALLEAVGPDGIVAVPTFTKTFKNAQDGPAGEVWNPARTPSRVGSFTNYVLQRPGAMRSGHPTHSIAALGKRAKEFCAGHSWRDGATTFDRNGPWGKLADWNGKILWLGTTMTTQTAVHVVEDWMRLPYMATCVALVDDNDVTREVDVIQSPAGPRDFYKKGSKAEQAWTASGKGRRGRACKAECHLMSAPEFIDWLWHALLKDPALLLSDNPQDQWSVEARKKTAAYLANFTGTWRRP